MNVKRAKVPEVLRDSITNTIKEVCQRHYQDGHNASSLTSERFQRDLVEEIMAIDVITSRPRPNAIDV